jgi:phosphoglycolate phosphatase
MRGPRPGGKLPAMQIRNIILDWSGTMVDDMLPVLHTTNYVLKSCGQSALTLDEFRRDFRLPVRKFYETRVPHRSLSELEQLFLGEYPRYQDEIQMLPHTWAFLEFCAERGLRVFVASSVDARTYLHQMQRFRLDRYITRPYIGIEDKTEKIHHILSENSLRPEETLFVGDMEHDIEAGRAGGVHTCAVLSGYNHIYKLRAMQPDLICEHLGELQVVLARLEESRG